MMPRGSASERGYGSLHRNPGLDMDAKAYVRRAWGLCIDVRCTRPASDKYRRGTEVVAQSKPRLYCPKHEKWAEENGDVVRFRQSVYRLGRDLGLTN
jgi:hypothetical protein